MEKRAHKRTTINVQTHILYDRALYPAIATNFSITGMYIKSNNCPPLQSILNIHFYLKGKFLDVPVEVNRLVENSGFNNGMGVKVQTPDKDYLAFLDRLQKINCNECSHNNDCHYLNSDLGDLRFLLNNKCEHLMLDTV